MNRRSLMLGLASLGSLLGIGGKVNANTSNYNMPDIDWNLAVNIVRVPGHEIKFQEWTLTDYLKFNLENFPLERIRSISGQFEMEIDGVHKPGILEIEVLEGHILTRSVSNEEQVKFQNKYIDSIMHDKNKIQNQISSNFGLSLFNTHQFS